MEQRRKAQLRTECLHTLPAYTQDGSPSKKDLTYTQLMLSLKLIKTEWLGISRQWGAFHRDKTQQVGMVVQARGHSQFSAMKQGQGPSELRAAHSLKQNENTHTTKM